MSGPWIGSLASALVSVVFFSVSASYEGRKGGFETWFWTRAVARVAMFAFGACLLKAVGAM